LALLHGYHFRVKGKVSESVYFLKIFCLFLLEDQQTGTPFTEILPCPLHNVWGYDVAPRPLIICSSCTSVFFPRQSLGVNHIVVFEPRCPTWSWPSM